MKKQVYQEKPPKLSALAQCIIDQALSDHQRRGAAPHGELPPETQKVLVIVRFASAGQDRFAVVKDKTKALQGLPGGGRDATDATLVDTVVRECFEELRLVVLPEQVVPVGEVQVRPDRNHQIYVFGVYLSDREIFAGIEQAFVQKLSVAEIDELVEQEAFLRNHAAAWRGYKENILK